MKNLFFRKTTDLFRQKIKSYLSNVKQWLVNTPERALLEAYEAAQVIRNIEIEHFGNQRISASSGNYTENVISYWQGSLNKNLTIINIRLAEFRLSRSMVDVSNTAILEKLQFIDDVISKYTPKNQQINSNGIVPIPETLPITNEVNRKEKSSSNTKINNVPPVTHKTGFLPRSLGRTFNKIRADLSPQAEEQFVRSYQITQKRTRVAIRFFLILILVPTLTQHFSKNLLIKPLLEITRGENAAPMFLNRHMEEKALTELKIFEHKLKFERFLYESPTLSDEEFQEKISNKASDIADEFSHKSNNAISNVFADLMSLFAFGVVVAMSKKEIVIVKSFIDTLVYGLSDSAKAFLIILFTDIFVGFHSPHGWEVLLENFSDHLGLPANRTAIFFFIATFPVILDTISKYWVFRYLSRLSPSALATFKEMNE